MMRAGAILFVLSAVSLAALRPAVADDAYGKQRSTGCPVEVAGYVDAPDAGGLTALDGGNSASPCLTIGVHANAVWLQNPSRLGVGVVRGTGPDRSLALGQDSWDQGWGGGLSLEYDLGASSGVFGLGNSEGSRFLFAEVEGSWAESKSTGENRIGVNGITNVGVVLIEPFPTGPNTTVAGFSISAGGISLPGSLETDSDWKFGTVGVGHVIPLTAGPGTGSGVIVKAGALLEETGFSSGGRVDLLFNGNPYPGVGRFQVIDYESSDIYAGLKLGVDYYLQLRQDIRLLLGANLTTGYHAARGDINERAGFETFVTEQGQRYRADDVFLGGGLSAKVDWQPLPGWSLATGIAVDYVPDVTGYLSPTEFFEEPGRFRSEDVWRVDVTLLNLGVQF